MSVVEMRTRRKNQIRQEFDELKDWLTDQEREDFEGAGTGTFAATSSAGATTSTASCISSTPRGGAGHHARLDTLRHRCFRRR